MRCGEAEGPGGGPAGKGAAQCPVRTPRCCAGRAWGDGNGMGGCVQKARKLHGTRGDEKAFCAWTHWKNPVLYQVLREEHPWAVGWVVGVVRSDPGELWGGHDFQCFYLQQQNKTKTPTLRASVFSWPHIYILKSEYSGGGGRCEKWLQSSPFESPAAFKGPLPCCKGEYSAPFCLQSLTEVLYLFSLLFEKKLSSCLRRSSLQIDFTFLLQKMFPWNENVMNVRSLACSCQAIPLIQFRMHLLESLFLDFCSCFLLCLDHLYICTSQFLLHQSS